MAVHEAGHTTYRSCAIFVCGRFNIGVEHEACSYKVQDKSSREQQMIALGIAFPELHYINTYFPSLF